MWPNCAGDHLFSGRSAVTGRREFDWCGQISRCHYVQEALHAPLLSYDPLPPDDAIVSYSRPTVQRFDIGLLLLLGGEGCDVVLLFCC